MLARLQQPADSNHRHMTPRPHTPSRPLYHLPCLLWLQEASEDVRMLARLWQLQAKMQTVDGGQGSAYEARIERVCVVAAGVEQRLAKRLELLDGYARVMNMIEIEVEMDMQVG